MKFSKNNYYRAVETMFFCVSDEYTDDMNYSEFRNQLKIDRESGLLEECGFKVDLRSNEIIDLEAEEDE